MEIQLYTVKNLSGLHCGIGQGLSDIDLPTAKEPVSGYPYIPGSSIKGVLRDELCRPDNKEICEAAFGRPAEKGDLDLASALSFCDARLICLPVRSYFGTFAYLTSPYALSVLSDALKQSDWTNSDVPNIPTFPKETDTYRVAKTSDSVLVGQGIAGRILLEDIDLLLHGDNADSWAEIIASLLYPNSDETGGVLFKQRFAITADDVMAFLCETALPVVTRIRIGDNGVVAPGALWYEEYVPPEAIFLGTIYAEKGYGVYSRFSANDLLQFVTAGPHMIQVGGHATIGRGIVKINYV